MLVLTPGRRPGPRASDAAQVGHRKCGLEETHGGQFSVLLSGVYTRTVLGDGRRNNLPEKVRELQF